MAEIKYTSRMALTDIINGTNLDKAKAWAEAELAKLDAKNAKRKTAEGEIKAENKDLANAILGALTNGQMLSVDLAQALGVTVPKLNGTALEMVKLGMLDKTKVKVKGKGEQTAYSLPTPTEAEAETATEAEAEAVAE